MKQLIDYKGTESVIKFNSHKEYLKLRPKINEVFKGWQEHHFNNGRHVDEILNMRHDLMSPLKNYPTFTIIQASEFLEEKEEIINNTYEIF